MQAFLLSRRRMMSPEASSGQTGRILTVRPRFWWRDTTSRSAYRLPKGASSKARCIGFRPIGYADLLGRLPVGVGQEAET